MASLVWFELEGWWTAPILLVPFVERWDGEAKIPWVRIYAKIFLLFSFFVKGAFATSCYRTTVRYLWRGVVMQTTAQPRKSLDTSVRESGDLYPAIKSKPACLHRHGANCRQGCLCFGLCGPHQCSADTGADTWQKQALYHMPGWLTLTKASAATLPRQSARKHL